MVRVGYYNPRRVSDSKKLKRDLGLLRQERQGVEECLMLDRLAVADAPADGQFQLHRPPGDSAVARFAELDFGIKQPPDDLTLRHELLWTQGAENIGGGNLGGHALDAVKSFVFAAKAKIAFERGGRFPHGFVGDCFEKRAQVGFLKGLGDPLQQFFGAKRLRLMGHTRSFLYRPTSRISEVELLVLSSHLRRAMARQ